MTDPLVLIPGFMADGRVFVDQLPGLSQTRSVQIAPLLGETHEDIASYILEHAPPKFAVAGHDLGATIAIELLRRAPERVTRIALICASAQAEPANAAAAREPRMVKAKVDRLSEALSEELPNSTLFDSPHRTDIRDHWMDMAMSMGIETYLRHSKIMQRRPDMQNVLRRARLPSLVVGCGANTISPPRRQEFMAQLMPRADFVLLKNAGHLPMFEAPRALTEALNHWLHSD